MVFVSTIFGCSKWQGWGVRRCGTWTLRCAFVALHDSHSFWSIRNNFQVMSTMQCVRGNIMCTIILILLIVTTSESLIPRPCFQLLLRCLLSVLLHVTLLPLLFQITQITSFTPYYTTFTVSSPNQCTYPSDNCIRCVDDARESSQNHSIRFSADFCY